jgi:hypothetical protein
MIDDCLAAHAQVKVGNVVVSNGVINGETELKYVYSDSNGHHNGHAVKKIKTTVQ